MTNHKNQFDSLRALGNAEYFYELYSRIASTNFCIVFETKKRVDHIELTKSINYVLNQYKIFSAEIIQTNRSELIYADVPYKRNFVEQKSGSNIELDFLIKGKINEVSKDSNTVIQTTIYYNSEINTYYLIFTFNHTRTDAIGGIEICKRILYNLGKIYYKKKYFKKDIHKNLEQLIPRTKKILTIKALYQYIVDRLKVSKNCKSSKSLLLNDYNFDGRNVELFKLQIDIANYEILIQKCRMTGFTVNEILSAIQLSAIRKEFKYYDKNPLILSIPINLRDKLINTVPRDVPGLFISIPKLIIRIKKDESIIQIAKKVQKDLRNQIKYGQIFIDWKFLPKRLFNLDKNSIKRIEERFSKNMPSSVLTNLGTVHFSNELSNVAIKSISFYVAPPKDSFLCNSVCSYKKQIIINCCFNSDLLKENSAICVVRRMDQLIYQFINE